MMKLTLNKPQRAYAIIDSNGKLACWSRQVPIYWRRRIALDACDKFGFADSKVIAVYITAENVSQRARRSI